MTDTERRNYWQELAQAGIHLKENYRGPYTYDDPLDGARQLYEQFGPFELTFQGDPPDWYENTEPDRGDR